MDDTAIILSLKMPNNYKPKSSPWMNDQYVPINIGFITSLTIHSVVKMKKAGCCPPLLNI